MLSLLAQTAVSFVATVSFAILFQVPREQYVYSGLCGAAGWLCYLLAGLCAAALAGVRWLERPWPPRRPAPLLVQP